MTQYVCAWHNSYDVPADFDVEGELLAHTPSGPSSTDALRRRRRRRQQLFSPQPHDADDDADADDDIGGLVMSDAAEFGLRQAAVRVELLATQRVPQWQRAVSRPGSVYETAVALTRAGPEAEAFRTQVPVGVLSARFHIVAAAQGSGGGGANATSAAPDADAASMLPVVLDEARRSAWETEQKEAAALALQQLRRYTYVWVGG